MKKYANTTEETLVAFHIGRGGRFNNQGYKIFVDQDRDINDFLGDSEFASWENYKEVSEKIGDRENLRTLLESADGNSYAQNRLKELGLDLGEEIYTDCNGDPVGLAVDNDGTGCIDQDGEYDTTYVNRLEDCNDQELELIYKSDRYVSNDVRDYCKTILLEKNLIFDEEE